MLMGEGISEAEMDKIYIDDLRVDCIIGVNPEERINKQEVIISAVICIDLRKAGISDNLIDTVDYFCLCNHISNYVSASSFILLEALAEGIADIVLNTENVLGVKVLISKPEALVGAKAKVEIVRGRYE